MYARVTVLEWKQGQEQEGVEETIRILRESILPETRQQHGFKDFLVLHDQVAGKILVITLWETQAALEANEASGYYHEQIDKLASFFPLYATPPYRHVYEVIVHAQELG
jgi:heme-degrading monooxygenase HmoA